MDVLSPLLRIKGDERRLKGGLGGGIEGGLKEGLEAFYSSVPGRVLANIGVPAPGRAESMAVNGLVCTVDVAPPLLQLEGGGKD